MLRTRSLLEQTRRRKRKHKNRTPSKKHCSNLKNHKLVSTKEQCDEESHRLAVEQDDDCEMGFDLKDSAQSNGHGVQPLGNLYFSTSSYNARDAGLGNLQLLSDELILEILGLLQGAHLGVLSAVSKSFYVFCNHEPLWRNLVLETYKGEFLFSGSWKSTYVSTYMPSFKISNFQLEIRNFYSDYLFQSWLCANLEMKSEWLERDNIIRRRDISVEEFVREFEEPNIPVLLEGCLDKWIALEKWNRDYLVEVSGDAQFAVGPVEMKLQHFFRYSDQAREERPLYLFDPKFGSKAPQLGQDYEVPKYFNEDLFGLLGDERPDYRWIIIGPAGSGSSFHIDPNSTSAWNAVIKGRKKWILFPPDVVPPGVHPSSDGAEVACPVSIMEWFMNFYNSTKILKKRPIECVCKAGEVVFVPNGWWHLVINLEDSTAITQNFVSRRNLVNVLNFLKRPNACSLVSGTSDRVNLYDKFKTAMEAAFPGTIDQLMAEAEKEAQKKKLSFWESVADSNAGAFKFSS